MKIKNINKDKIYDFIIIKASIALNNIFMTITDVDGNVLIKKSAGLLDFTNTKKKIHMLLVWWQKIY